MISKPEVVVNIMRYAVSSYGRRILRLLYLLSMSLHERYPLPIRGLMSGVIHLLLLIGDLLLVPELLIIINTLVKSDIRVLTVQEREAIAIIYGDNLDLDQILVDPTARIMTRKHAIAYVSWHMINYWQSLTIPVIIHECQHILQYNRVGSPYIYEALMAQRSSAGYDYGGGEALHHAMMMGRSLSEYNLEQQAEIMEDAYRCYAITGEIPLAYRYYITQLDTFGITR